MNWNILYNLYKRKHRACYLKIFSIINDIKINSIVEVGVFRGKNALVLRNMFPHSRLYLVDTWEPTEEYLEYGGAVSEKKEVYEQAFTKVNTLFQNDSLVTIIKESSEKASQIIPNNIDLVFIDADHSYEHVKQDILAWSKKVRVGGIVSGHNYGRPHLPGVKQPVDELLKTDIFLGQDEVWAHIKKTCTEEDSNL